ncbi:MAG: glycine oxidase ThiO [Actinomycetota bacterium]
MIGSDVAVVGGGVIGLACAWRLAQRGASVTVFDPAPGSGASHAAAGMLAPVTEVHHGEEPLLALNLASAQLWPAFAAELVDAAGIDIGHRTDGTLAVALDDDDLRSLKELRGFQESLHLPVTRLTSRECRTREPSLSPRVRGGVLAANDHQVDSRLAVQALLATVERSGVTLVREPVTALSIADHAVTGVDTPGGRHACGTVVVAAGSWSADIDGIPPAAMPPVRPVKGQILRLRFDPAAAPLQGTIRGLAAGRSVYLVPRSHGELVVGATVEEVGFDTTVTAGAVHDLLRAAIDLVPAVAELKLVEATARLRPGTPDNAPLIGPTGLDGLVLATGHHRNGVLLAPVTAEVIASVVTTGTVPPVADRFDPGRFQRCISA